MKPLFDYLSKSTPPYTRTKAHNVQIKSKRYLNTNDKLYQKLATGVFLQCLTPKQVEMIKVCEREQYYYSTYSLQFVYQSSTYIVSMHCSYSNKHDLRYKLQTNLTNSKLKFFSLFSF